MSAQPDDEPLKDEVLAILHKATIEDEVLDDKGMAAELGDDLRLGGNDMVWIAGRLSDLSNGHGGRPIFTSTVEDCDTVADLVEAYIKAVRSAARKKSRKKARKV